MSQFENADGRNFLRWIFNVTTASTARLLSLADWSLNWQTCQRSTRGNISTCQSIGVKWLWKVFLDSSCRRFQEWWPCFLAALLHWPLKVRPWQVLASSGMPSIYISAWPINCFSQSQTTQTKTTWPSKGREETSKDATNHEEDEQFRKGGLWGAGGLLWWIRPLRHHCPQSALTQKEHNDD